MRILALSDLHCDREAAKNIVTESAAADVVVGAGDFGIRGERSTELPDILKGISNRSCKRRVHTNVVKLLPSPSSARLRRSVCVATFTMPGEVLRN